MFRHIAHLEGTYKNSVKILLFLKGNDCNIYILPTKCRYDKLA